jgi:HAD superfamily hydrolase (TIGR01509 family)
MQGWGINFSEDDFYALAGTPTVHIVQRLLERHGVPGKAPEIAHLKELAFLELLPDVRPIEPVVELAKRCQPTHLMGVGSGSSRTVVSQILKHIGLAEFFEVVVTAEDTSRHKPEPDVFLEVANRIGVAPQRCCVFEDADLGIEAARRGGMHYFDIRSIFTPRRITN